MKHFSLLTDFDVQLFGVGKHYRLYEKLGSHVIEQNGEKGVFFAVWAPNALKVSVVGNFNNWNPLSHRMNPRWDVSGIWEIFIPGLKNGDIYKYSIFTFDDVWVDKTDPFARMTECPPKSASVVWNQDYEWKDKDWMTQRKENVGKHLPQSTYEVHLGSWKKIKEEDNRSLSYTELATELVNYVKELGYSYVELMPVMEHPFYGSWGYQITNYFAPSARYGTPEELKHLIDAFHQANIGVILDWVPSHFPMDEHGLSKFDGTYLFEHADPRKGYHPDWKSAIFNYGRNEVKAFLISNALYWLDEFHVDGLRVDAVASMLYLDYSRKEGEWVPNKYGGNQNLEAVDFLREFNTVAYREYPDIVTIAEESTAWPGVSKPVYDGGLGFGQKWMMGWMHDTLRFLSRDLLYRKFHQNEITFSIIYAFTERFTLAISHDEVVHGKGSMVNKMPGNEWQKFANLRLFFSYMYGHPGTKLLFMGAEFGQTYEWSHDRGLDWWLTEYDYHKQIQQYVKDINHLYNNHPALYVYPFESEGFEWVALDDYQNNVIAFYRKTDNIDDTILVVLNFSANDFPKYEIGVPLAGTYKEILNSNQKIYGGNGNVNGKAIVTKKSTKHGKMQSVTIQLPPLGGVFFSYKKKEIVSKTKSKQK